MSNDGQERSSAAAGETVRLTITQFDPAAALSAPRQVILDREVAAEEVVDVATGWLAQDGRDATGRLCEAVTEAFAKDVPTDRFRGLLNKPHGLAFIATWPGAVLPAELQQISARED